MILDCYIIREYLPNGKHTDHGYYEEAEMLEDLAEFQTGSNRFEVIPCTADDVRYGLNHDELVLSIHGKEAVNLTNEYCNDIHGRHACYVNLFDGGVKIGQMEPVLDSDEVYNGLDQHWTDVTVNINHFDDVLAQLHDMGFAGMWCFAMLEHSNGSTEEGGFFQI